MDRSIWFLYKAIMIAARFIKLIFVRGTYFIEWLTNDVHFQIFFHFEHYILQSQTTILDNILHYLSNTISIILRTLRWPGFRTTGRVILVKDNFNSILALFI